MNFIGGGLQNRKLPYLSYTIYVKSSRLNTTPLSDYQIKLYQKICELRFDENLTWKQVADRLNQDGSIDVLDIINGIYIIIENLSSNEYECQSYLLDINEDGSTNILDIVIIVDIALNI